MEGAVNNRPLLSVLAAALMLAVLSCAAPPERGVEKVPEAPTKPKLTVKEQNELAMKAYNDILDMTIENRKRDILPELEVAYNDLISRYPDSFLAQESHWRLISMNLVDYPSPRIDVAEKYYDEFLQRYPGSKMKMILDDTMARYYYRNRLWDRLVKKCSSYVRDYVSTGKINTPLFMFLYSEAKFNLGDPVEAEKGYKIVIHHFPGSTEASISKERLARMKDSR